MAGKYNYTNYKGFKADLNGFEEKLNKINISGELGSLELPDEMGGDPDKTVQHRVEKIKALIDQIKTSEGLNEYQMNNLWSELRECVASCILLEPAVSLDTAQGRSLWAFSGAMRTLNSTLDIMQNQQWRTRAESAVEEIKQAEEEYTAIIDDAARDINPALYPGKAELNSKTEKANAEYEKVTAEYSQKYAALDQRLTAAEMEFDQFNRQHRNLDRLEKDALAELAEAEKELTLQGDFVSKLESEYTKANEEFAESMRLSVAAADEELAKAAKPMDEAEKLAADTEKSIESDRKFIADFEKEMKDLDDAKLPEYMANINISQEDRLLYLRKITLQNLRSEALIANMPGEIERNITIKPNGETVTLEKAEEMINQGRAMQSLQPNLLNQYRENGNEYTRSSLQMYDRFINYKNQFAEICKGTEVLKVLLKDVERANSIKALKSCIDNAGALMSVAMDNTLKTITPEMKESLVKLKDNFRSLQSVKNRLHEAETNIDFYKSKAASTREAYETAVKVHDITLKDLAALESPTSKLNQAKTERDTALEKVEELRKKVQGIKDLKETREKLNGDIKSASDEKNLLESKMAEAQKNKSEMDALNEKLNNVNEAYTGVASKNEDLQNQLGLEGEVSPMVGMEGQQSIFDTLKFYSDTSEMAKEEGHKNTPEFNDMVESVRSILSQQDGPQPLTNAQLIEKLEHVAERSQNYLREKQKGIHLFTYTMRETRLAYAKELKNFAETSIANIKANVKAAEDALKAGKEAADSFYNGKNPYSADIDHIKDTIAPLAKEKYFNQDGSRKVLEEDAAEAKNEPIILDGYTTIESVLNLGNYNAVTSDEMAAFDSFKSVMTGLAESSTGMKYFIIALGQPRDGHASALARMYDDYKTHFDKYDAIASESKLCDMVKSISEKKHDVKNVEEEQKSVQLQEKVLN